MQPEGFYKGRFTRWGISKSSKGTLQWVGEMKITDYAGEDDPNGNYQPVEKAFRRSVFLYLSPACRARSLAELRFLGLPEDANKSKLVEYLEPGGDLSVDFGKAEVIVECKHETYAPPGSATGKDREKYQICRRKGFEALGAEDRSQLNSMLEETAEEISAVPI